MEDSQTICQEVHSNIASGSTIPSNNVVDVVVVGSGPAGMAATSVLLGNHPVYLGGHPDHVFDKAMKESLCMDDGNNGTSESSWILDADFELLTANLKGRSNNPVALLGDHLMFPFVDQGMQESSCVTTKYRKDRSLNVIMIGDDNIGGSWNQFPPQTMTLSPGSWMSLPFWPMEEWLQQQKQQQNSAFTSSDATRISPSLGRIPREFVSSYYNEALKGHFKDVYISGKVERISPLTPSNGTSISTGTGWKIVASANTKNGDNAHTVATTMTWNAKAVVLATGTYSNPKKLENVKDLLGHPNLTHRIPKSWPPDISNNLVVVGAGMSASDCIIAAMKAGVRVYHVFRGGPEKSNIARKFTSARGMYSDYGRLVEMMKGELSSNLYQPYQGSLLQARDDGSCSIRLENEVSELVELKEISQVAILIGSTPDLSFVEGVEIGSVVSDPLNAYPGTSSTHPQYVNVDPFTMEVHASSNSTPSSSTPVKNLFAIGPLRGDNFVRFLTSDAWGIAKTLWPRIKH